MHSQYSISKYIIDLNDEIGNRTLNKKTPDFTFLGVKSGACFVKH